MTGFAAGGREAAADGEDGDRAGSAGGADAQHRPGGPREGGAGRHVAVVEPERGAAPHPRRGQRSLRPERRPGDQELDPGRGRWGAGEPRGDPVRARVERPRFGHAQVAHAGARDPLERRPPRPRLEHRHGGVRRRGGRWRGGRCGARVLRRAGRERHEAHVVPGPQRRRVRALGIEEPRRRRAQHPPAAGSGAGVDAGASVRDGDRAGRDRARRRPARERELGRQAVQVREAGREAEEVDRVRGAGVCGDDRPATGSPVPPRARRRRRPRRTPRSAPPGGSSRRRRRARRAPSGAVGSAKVADPRRPSTSSPRLPTTTSWTPGGRRAQKRARTDASCRDSAAPGGRRPRRAARPALAGARSTADRRCRRRSPAAPHRAASRRPRTPRHGGVAHA